MCQIYGSWPSSTAADDGCICRLLGHRHETKLKGKSVTICRILTSVCVRSVRDLLVSLSDELPLQNTSICALNIPVIGPTLGGVSLTVLDSCCQLSCPGLSDTACQVETLA
jgi:hypothetical protein